MRQTPQNMKELLSRVKDKLHLKSLVIALSAIVVFTTTYMLILPAFTLDKQEAAEQGGIDVVAAETVAETADTEVKEEAPAEVQEDQKAEDKADANTEAAKKSEDTDKAEKADKTEKSDVKLLTKKKTINADQADGDKFAVSAVVGKDAKVPADVTLTATELDKKTDGFDYDQYKQDALKALKKDSDVKGIKSIKFYDISLESESQDAVEPEAMVNVKIAYEDGMKVDNADNIRIVHFATQENGTEKPVVLDNAENKVETTTNESGSKVTEASFDTDGFSKYAVAEVETIEKTITAADNKTYKVTVKYDDEAGIPEGATLDVKEIANDEKSYTGYVEKAAKVLADGEKVPFVNSARLFDISIMADGKKVEPKAPVDVQIEYANAENLNKTSEVGAVHFKGDTSKAETEVVDVEVQGKEGKVDGVTFTADSFSIYAIMIIDKESGTFVVEDDTYKVTITYTEEANIPIGTELTVKEITPEEDEYWKLRKSTVKKINEGVKWEDTELTPDPRKGITDAVFFDISLVNGGKEIEPDVPLQVKIEYKDGGILVPDNEDTQIIHFAKEGTETIDDVDVQYADNTEDGSKIAVSYEYEQSSFSAVGSYSTGEYIDINKNNIINPKASISTASMLRAAGDSSIAASKSITDDNHDGVYDLTLNVTGQSESSSSTTVNKSNVVVVVDVSGSMDFDTYSKYTGTGTSSGTYYGVYNGNYFNVYWINNRWQYYYNDRYNNYNGDVYIQESRLAATKRALKELVSALLANNKDEVKDGVNLNDIVEITLVKFAYANETNSYNGTSTLIRNVNTDTEKAQLDTIIDNLWAGGGTNWERALQVAKDEADRYKRNQPNEPVSVIFMTDGVCTSWGTTNTYGNEDRGVTHYAWNEADDDARAIVNAGYTLYDIFAFGTDTTKYSGDSSRTDADYLRSLTNYAYSGSGTYANTTLTAAARPYFFNAKDTSALQDAFNAIINSISGNVGYGGVMVDDGVTTGVTSTSVTVDGSVNTDKFKYSIKNGSNILATVHIQGNNATFTINGTDYPATGETVTTVIDGTTHTNTVFSVTVGDKVYKMSPASFDNNGKIQWDLAGIGIIENGYTYELQFEVWPNQLAYDMVADLNNGVKTLDEIKADVIASQGQAVWDQIEKALVSVGNGKYAVRTNYEQYVDYYTVKTEKNEQTGEETTTYEQQPRKELGPKDPVALTSSTMDLRKLWDDSLDLDQFDELLWKDITRNEQGEVADQTPSNSREYSVKLHIWKADTLDDLNSQISQYAEAVDGSYAQADEHDYLSKTLGWDGSKYDWADSLEVAPGTMIEISKAQEMGIDVTKHTQVTYNGKTYLVLESGHYYTVTEESIDRHFELNTVVYHPMLVDGVLSNVTFKDDDTVEKIVPMSTVDATNTLKGGINVQKKVFDGEGHEVTEVIVSDDTFKVKITMKNADDTPYENWDYRIYYGQNNPNVADGRSDHNYGPSGNGGIIETNLYIGDVIRIINVPAGVTYTVQETEYDNTVYTLGSNYTFPLTTGGEDKSFTTDNTGVSYMISKGESDNFVADSDKKVLGNAASQAIVVNKVPTAKIKLLKVGNSTTPLDGVKFKIFYDEECTKPVTKDATGQFIPGIGSDGAITTDANGYADLGTLAGSYYLQEITTKDGYNLLAAPVKVTVVKDGNDTKVTASSTEDGVIFDRPGWIAKDADGVWVVKVNNSTGVELPNSGGIGTTIFYILGSLLAIGCGIVLVSRRRIGVDK